MAILGNKRDTGQTTLVGFHDLLGFGELLASSEGTLNSAVGEIAHKRILGLRQSVAEIQNEFPKDAMFFHFNDTVTVYLDVDVDIDSSHTDPSGIAATPVKRSQYEKILRFVSGCGALHQRSIAREDEDRLGAAGRTFIVLGKRWDLGKTDSKRIFEVPPLHANLAFAEAYLADQSGSRGGFLHRTFYRIYVNDFLWLILCAGGSTLSHEKLSRLSTLGDSKEQFPGNLCAPGTDPVSIEIFHRKRVFRSLMSHHVCDISKTLRGD